MKFLIEKEVIAKALGNVRGITSRKSNLAITGGVMIKAEAGGITLTATDLETGFRGAYPARVDAEGSVILSAAKFFDIVKGFPGDAIRVDETEKQWVVISGNNNVEYQIVGANPEDFPDIPNIEEVDFFDMFSADLRRMSEQSLTIEGEKNDRRAHILGVLFETFESADGIKLVRSVSTDGCRLAYSECVQASETPGGIAVLIPKKGLSEVVKFLDSDGTVQVGVKGNSFIIKKDAETIIIRLLEGDFPKYAEILLPADDSVPLRIDRQGFLATLKRMSILYSENNKGVKIKLSPGQMTVSAKNPDLGESKETLDISYDGAVFEVAFNPKYLIGVLSVIKDEMALVTIIDERRPCLIEGEADKSYRSVIMPMRA